MDQLAASHRPPLVQGLLQGIPNEARTRRAAGPPADDTAGIDVDDEGHIDEAGPAVGHR